MEPIMDFGHFTLSRGASWYQHYESDCLEVFVHLLPGASLFYKAVMDDFGDLVKVDRLMAEVA